MEGRGEGGGGEVGWKDQDIGPLGVQYWMQFCSWWLKVDRWELRSVRSNR